MLILCYSLSHTQNWNTHFITHHAKERKFGTNCLTKWTKLKTPNLELSDRSHRTGRGGTWLFTPINVGNMHWVLLAAHPTTAAVSVIDSSDFTSSKKYCVFLTLNEPRQPMWCCIHSIHVKLIYRSITLSISVYVANARGQQISYPHMQGLNCYRWLKQSHIKDILCASVQCMVWLLHVLSVIQQKNSVTQLTSAIVTALPGLKDTSGFTGHVSFLVTFSVYIQWVTNFC